MVWTSFWRGAVCVTMIAWLAGLVGGERAPAAMPAGGDGPILVGHFASMSGSEATFGQSTDAGIRLAVKEINAAGGVKGRQIELKTYDDQGKPQEAGTAVTRFITSDKVVAVLGEVASSLSIAGGRVCQQYGVPMITPSSTNPGVTRIGDMVFRVCYTDPFQGEVCARFARDRLKAKKAATLYDQQQAYSKGLNDYFKKAFIELGGTITTEQAYSGGDQDFGAQLISIRDTQPDVLFMPGYYTDVANIALQVRKLGITVPLLGGDGWDSDKLSKIGGAAIEGAYYANHYAPDEQRPEVQEFIKRYQAEFKGEVPDGMAATGYDAALILFDAMKRAPSLDGKVLAKAIAETKGFHGVTGAISIDKDRNANKPCLIVQVKDGKTTFVTSYTPK
jgi:branched-chain amino acid transport system substrate-binding protein